MASRRRSSNTSSRTKRTAKRSSGGGFRWGLWIVVLAGLALGIWIWRPIPDSKPSPKPEPPQPRTTPGIDEDLSVPLPPPVTNEIPEGPRVRVSTNRIRAVPDPSSTRTSNGSTNLVAPGVRSGETNKIAGGPKEEVPSKPKMPPGARPVRDAFEAQLVLARRVIASGPLDGAMGSQTRAALQVFQQYEGLPTTGLLDNATRERLWIEGEPYAWFVVTQSDVDNLRSIPSTWLGKSQTDRLGYETILEMVSEASHSHPALIRKLNPTIDWSKVGAGESIKVPKADYPPPKNKASLIRISLSGKNLRAYDNDGVLLCFFPCSIAQRVDKRPVGDLKVEVVIKDPDYTFNPDVFPESAEARELKRKLRLPAGPNNPVGVAWIGLSRSGYGIHGTPKPEDVGRTESHGCFRLANWNADYLRQLVSVGTPVSVEP